MKKFLPSLLGLMLLAPVALATPEGSGSHGGDGIEIRFGQARVDAADAIGAMIEGNLSNHPDQKISEWLLKNRDALITDILQSPYVWITEEQKTCASTDLTSRAVIKLSIPTCRSENLSENQMGQLLIHESIHHFGIGDETFATDAAIQAYWAKSNATIASLSFSCNVSYGIPGKPVVSKEFKSKVNALKLYQEIDEPLIASKNSWNLKVIFAGFQSYIWLGSENSKKKYVSGSNTGFGQKFNMMIQPLDEDFSFLQVDCQTQSRK